METYWDSSWFNKYLTKEGAVPFFAMKMTCWAIIDRVQVVCDCETIRHRSQSTTLQHRFDGWEGQFYLSWVKFTSNLKIAGRSTSAGNLNHSWYWEDRKEWLLSSYVDDAEAWTLIGYPNLSWNCKPHADFFVFVQATKNGIVCYHHRTVTLLFRPPQALNFSDEKSAEVSGSRFIPCSGRKWSFVESASHWRIADC